MFDKRLFGKRLTLAIEGSGMSKREVARAVGISRFTLGRYCKGRRLPKTEVLVGLMTALNASGDYLLGNI